MSNFTDFIGGGGGTTTSLYNVWISKSATWTPPYSGVVTIHCIGAGGGGGVQIGTTWTRGGGGGGYCRKELTVSTGTNWTMVVGNGGDVAPSAGGSGSAGGNTSATDGSTTLTANGGGGGNTSSTAGGSASGGDVNFTGGGSGATAGGGSVGTTANGEDGAGSFNSQWAASRSDCDFVSPYDPLAYGRMTGGEVGGIPFWAENNVSHFAANLASHGGFGSGGGAIYNGTNYFRGCAGNGGIGGGGGGFNNNNKSKNVGSCQAGRGGDGIILVQYKSIT